MVSDPIADMLVRIKNAYLSRHKTVAVPYSKAKAEIGKILVREGYLKNQKTEKPKDQETKKIICKLKYENGQPTLTNLKRISKPGVRVYKKSKKIPFPPGQGIVLVSTPKGIMTGKQARQKKLGGEILCFVW